MQLVQVSQQGVAVVVCGLLEQSVVQTAATSSLQCLGARSVYEDQLCAGIIPGVREI